MVNYFVNLCVVERVADLPRDVLQVPDGKTVFAGERCRYRISLDIFGSSQGTLTGLEAVG